MSSNSDVDVSEVDFLVEPMDIDVILPVSDENVNIKGTEHKSVLYKAFFNPSCVRSCNIQLDTF